MEAHDESPKDRASAIQAMLARIPIEILEAEGLRLLSATRMVNLGRDREAVEEPDNPTRLRAWLACIEQGTGRPAQAPPIKPPKEADAKQEAGTLKARKREG